MKRRIEPREHVIDAELANGNLNAWKQVLGFPETEMSHEPGRERHMTHKCEKCGNAEYKLSLNESIDEYWCESCFDNEAEAAYDRQQERDLESPPESVREEQLRTWEEHQKAHKR